MVEGPGVHNRHVGIVEHREGSGRADNRLGGPCVTEITALDHHGPATASHRAAVAAIEGAYAAIPAGSPVRLAKKTSNLFRFRDDNSAPGLDVCAFGHVLQVSKQDRTAIVGGMTTYEDLVAATLHYGLMPMVVPQLKTITLGGAVSGLGIESTSL